MKPEHDEAFVDRAAREEDRVDGIAERHEAAESGGLRQRHTVEDENHAGNTRRDRIGEVRKEEDVARKDGALDHLQREPQSDEQPHQQSHRAAYDRT